MIPFPTNPNFPSVTCMHGIKKIIWNGHGYRQSHWVRLTVTVCILQSWALAHFFEVRYPLPTQFFPLDRWRSCVHFLNFPIRSSLKRSSLNQWIAERKRAESLTALYYKIMYLKLNLNVELYCIVWGGGGGPAPPYCLHSFRLKSSSLRRALGI
jgi:hypothetical protein